VKLDLLHALFHDIASYGSVRLKKSKLLWMLDRVHETPTVWDTLMREWRTFDAARPLYGLHWDDEITLTMAPAQDVAANWTSIRPARKRPEVPMLPLMLAASA
jgi:hypothetical protein